MKKYLQAVLLFSLTVLMVVTVPIQKVQAQYIGSGRPLSSAQMMDSLAAAEARAALQAAGLAGDSAHAVSGAEAGDSARAALVAAADSARKIAGDSARAVLTAARGEMSDSSATAFNRLILFYARISGDSVIVDSTQLVAERNLVVKGTLTVKALVADSFAAINDTLLAKIFRVTGQYSLPPRDTTAGLVLKSGGPGQPWYYAPDEVASGEGADSLVIGGLIHDSLLAFCGVISDSIGAQGLVDSAAAAGMISDSLAAHPFQRPDSVLYEGQWYDEVIGWDGTPEETITLNITAGIDSTSEDSLWYAVDRLKSTGGDIYIKSGDTLWLTRGGGHLDSLPTTGGITKPVRIWGNSKGLRPVISLSDTNANTYSFVFTAGRNCSAGMEWNNILFSGRVKAPVSNASDYCQLKVSAGQMRFNNCRFRGSSFWTACTGGADSTWYFRNCEMDSASFSFDGPVYDVTWLSCSGTVNGLNQCKSNNGSGVGAWFRMVDCDLTILNRFESRNYGLLSISGGRFYFPGNTCFIACYMLASGARFDWKASDTNTYLYGFQQTQITDCTFNYGWVVGNSSYSEVSSCHFWYGTYGIDTSAITNARMLVDGCTFNQVTTCIKFGGSSSNYTVATNNTSILVTTLISGTASVNVNNNDAI
ncbi:MAG: hypothetical protein A3F83_06055 [Candidatus Glassbacteria bacterium RIFCSPLOWO2_12_FULL_58_11]|uniref:Uncharacterized protein n=1 Tax=Candidatus Glassbacteria bacterium RIFCSPLOWO2_12_FULL_58_11 TaxID=1817867 RepID=A0A1F5YMZ7_9BACT|nr:MAG: hypothetical protein A3F83_06055 [Candidatus Glassbacteria bacterium RIFCSPLOWO2_12_FULL_58_11]